MVMTSSNLSILDEGAVLCRQFYVILNMIIIPVFSSWLFPKFKSKRNESIERNAVFTLFI